MQTHLFIFFRTVMFSDLSAQTEGSSLLCRPASEDQGPVFERMSLSYSLCSDQYRVGERSFSRQYAHIYAARLMQMRPLLSERAQQKWGKLRTSWTLKHLNHMSIHILIIVFFGLCQDQMFSSGSCVISRQGNSVALWEPCLSVWTCSHLFWERSAMRYVVMQNTPADEI